MNVGRFLIAILILTGLIGSLITGAAFYSHILYLGLLLVAAAWVWVRILARSLRFARQGDSPRASVGDIFKEQYEIINTSRLPGLWVQLLNEMPVPTAARSRLFTGFKRGQKQSYVP